MSKKDKISPEDAALFRNAVGPVTPLRHGKITVKKRRPQPIPVQTLRDQQQLRQDMLSDDAIDSAELETGEELSFTRPGLQHNVLRKLRRGQFSVGAELDLHGMTSSTARQALAAFLNRCRSQGIRCVRVIHGKGLGSPQRLPVLKGKVNSWLQQRNEVLAFCSSRPIDGGTGAVYVLLKTSAK